MSRGRRQQTQELWNGIHLIPILAPYIIYNYGDNKVLSVSPQTGKDNRVFVNSNFYQDQNLMFVHNYIIQLSRIVQIFLHLEPTCY